MTDSRHNRVAEQLVAYALDELTPAERRDVDAHLRACAACAHELREIQESLTAVGESVPAVVPPPALKARVLAAVAVQPQEPPSRQPVERRLRTTRVRWLAAAAAVALVAVSGALTVSEFSRRSLATELQRASAEVADLETRLGQFSAQTDLALSILTASDMRELSLAGRENAVAAAARAYWSPTRGLLVVADRLPAAPPGRTYQVWVIDNGQPRSAGLLGEPASGRGMLVAPPPSQGTGAAVTIAVTDEPLGGLPAPSGTIRLAGTI